MIKAQYHLLISPFLFFGAVCCLSLAAASAADEAFDLRAVKGMEAFKASAAAKELLARNGFVVADPAFKQIFEAYIESPRTEAPSEKNPMGASLPSFITTDSAWHTYHVLLEEGVKNMEEIQSRRLLDFSRRLWTVARERALTSGSNYNELARFASIGLALQDESQRKSLSPEWKRIVDGLRTGSAPVDVPIGFSLSPQLFRAQSFYTQSPGLSDYFAARQWYASVVFRFTDARETRLALALSALIEGNPELSALWKQLSDPFDAFLAPAEDGTVREYVAAAKTVPGTNVDLTSLSDLQLNGIRKQLDGRLALPLVSDQLLLRDQYAEFAKHTRGFRVLPPRRLPCAVCFHNTTDPKISGRMYPSGLDFLAASPVLRSPAAVRAVQNQFGKNVGDLILKADCGPMPDSLHGEAMRLLATLQKPLPAPAPAAMRNEAWSDLQLWTQLGAWAEQRHTWALHTKLTVSYLGIVTPPKGMVAPYPEFFSGLAKLTRRTVETFHQAGLEEKFEVKAVAGDLLERLNLQQSLSSMRNAADFEKISERLQPLGEFQSRYYRKHQAELERNGSRESYKQMQAELLELARRCAASGRANEAETETLRSYFDCRQDIARLLGSFAPVCDRLAELAKKSLAGQALTDEDAGWIEGYGVTLAGFHFYYGNSYEVPRDDFPIVTWVFSNPRTDSMLYAGLARPQSLYVIVADGKSQQLYRGAVMTYREFVRPNDQLLDDESWREMISKGRTPPAPPFTRSFCAETSVGELLKQLRESAGGGSYHDTRELLWQISSRVTENDLTNLLAALTQIKGDERGDIVEGLAYIIAPMPWQSRQKEVIELLAGPDNLMADAAARILSEQPAALDASLLTAGFERQPSRARRLVCALLARQPQPTETTRKVLFDALHDRDDGVRWQATLAIGTTNRYGAPGEAALRESLNDTNEFVAAAAAYSLARLDATNASPTLFAKLKTRLTSAPTAPEELRRQAAAITRDLDSDFNHRDFQILDPAHLEMRLKSILPPRARELAGMRLPMRPAMFPTRAYDQIDALIEALGDLHYRPAADELFKLRGTDHDDQATLALSKLDPGRLADELLATAKDKQLDSYVREGALITLCTVSATNRVRELIPLLDDVTPINYSRPMPGSEWRICDRTAVTIAILLGWERLSPIAIVYARPEQRDETMARVRKWASQFP